MIAQSVTKQPIVRNSALDDHNIGLLGGSCCRSKHHIGPLLLPLDDDRDVPVPGALRIGG
jgi:hypothetical protein